VYRWSGTERAVVLAEATRQYQATLEARRRLYDQTEGYLTFEDEQIASDEDLAEAYTHMRRLWEDQ
jgi:hypothetical protein